MKQLFLASILGSALVLSGCGGASDAVNDLVDNLNVTVSGTVTDSMDNPLAGVKVEGVYASPGDALNPVDSTDASGNFSIKILKNNAAYLQLSKQGFVTMNMPKKALNADMTGINLGLPTTEEAQGVLTAAYGTTIALSSRAWLAVDVVDANGDEVGGQSISVSGATAEKQVYTSCTGIDSMGTTTVGPCPDRPSPMYVSSFTAGATVTVGVGAETQTAVLRMGEVTYLEFEQ